MEIQKSCSSWVPMQEPAPSKSEHLRLAGPTSGFSSTHPKSNPNPPSAAALHLDTTTSLLHRCQHLMDSASPRSHFHPPAPPGWHPSTTTSRTLLQREPSQYRARCHARGAHPKPSPSCTVNSAGRSLQLRAGGFALPPFASSLAKGWSQK